MPDKGNIVSLEGPDTDVIMFAHFLLRCGVSRRLPAFGRISLGMTHISPGIVRLRLF